MTTTTPGADSPFKKIIALFWSFDDLIGSRLIKLLYYIGVVAIAIGVVVNIFGGLNIMRYSFGGGLGMVLLSPVGGAVALILWRFLCELYLLAYLFYGRLGEIRDRLPPQ